MSKFNKPKDIKTTPVASKPNLDSELGFSSLPSYHLSNHFFSFFLVGDEVKSDTESSSSSSGDEDNDKKSEPSGFFILQHRNAQENLKQLTEQKLKVQYLSIQLQPSFLFYFFTAD
jgi:hypothetical protein